MSHKAHPLFKDFFAVYCSLSLFIGLLFLLVSCHTVKQPVSPYSPILPPGYVRAVVPSNAVLPVPGLTASPMLANVPRPAIRRTLLASPSPNVVLICDIDLSGPFDGVHVYSGPQTGSLSLLATFDHTNVFPVSLTMDRPSFVEVRTFINWRAPGIVQTWTNDDGSTGSQTERFYESGGADYVFVPTNCPVIALMPFTNGLQLVGWGAAGMVYQIQSSTDLASWSSNATVTGTNGPYQVWVDSSQQQTFWRTSSP